MTDLSPAAQAIINAAVEGGGGYGRATTVLHARIATALRAVVQELKYFGITEKNILAIAAELEGNTTSEIN
jgi:ribosomal protein S9